MRASLTKYSSLNFSWAYLAILFPKFIQILIQTWCFLTQRCSYHRHRVVKYHFFFVVFVCFWCFWCNPGWENVRYVESIGTHGTENSVWSKRNWAIFCPAVPENPSTQTQSSQTKESCTSGLIFGVFSALSRDRGSSDRPQLVRAGLPLTTGKLSGVWERTLAVSAELAAPTH